MYTGTQPAHADDAPNSLGAVTYLGAFALSATAFASAAGSGPTAVHIDLNAVTSIASAPASGTATWFRLELVADHGGGASTTALRMDGSCGTGTGDLSFDSASIAAGQVVALSSGTLNMAPF